MIAIETTASPAQKGTDVNKYRSPEVFNNEQKPEFKDRYTWAY